jgi:hypothetical protein
LIFSDGSRYYIGTIGADGNWYDRDSTEVFDEIEGWAFLPPEPITITGGGVVQEWNAGNGPVAPTFKHFLLVDHDVCVYKNIESAYFDSQNKTFPEVSHWLALPVLPLRLLSRGRIGILAGQITRSINSNPQLKSLKIDAFSSACLVLAIDEVYNTTINGVRRQFLLNNEEMLTEMISRWAFRVNNWLNKAEGKEHAGFTFEEITPPTDQKERLKIRESLELVQKYLVW